MNTRKKTRHIIASDLVLQTNNKLNTIFARPPRSEFPFLRGFRDCCLILYQESEVVPISHPPHKQYALNWRLLAVLSQEIAFFCSHENEKYYKYFCKRASPVGDDM